MRKQKGYQAARKANLMGDQNFLLRQILHAWQALVQTSKGERRLMARIRRGPKGLRGYTPLPAGWHDVGKLVYRGDGTRQGGAFSSTLRTLQPSMGPSRRHEVR